MNPPLPDVHQGVLDEDALGALLSDLREHAEVLDVRVKGGPTERSDATELGVDDVATLLRGGARGVQIRYRFQGDEWRDTLLPAEAGVRIVRMKLCFEP